MTRQDYLDAVEENRGWFAALGILLIVAGGAAIALPHIATLSAEFLFGGLLFATGVMRAVAAFRAKKWTGMLLELAIGVLYVVTALLIAWKPIQGAIALTFMLAVLFNIEGIARIALGVQMRPEQGWGWIIASGVLAVIAGVLIAAKLPSSGVWAIGLLVGVNMFMAGWTFLVVSLFRRDASEDAGENATTKPASA